VKSKLVSLARPHHWIKNGLVFAPLIFSKNAFEPALVMKTLVTFLSFSLVSSSVYVLNDLKDAEFDRLHPEKKDRPIASGEVSEKLALWFTGILLAAGLIVGAAVGGRVLAVLAVYFALNALYSYHLKKVVIIDVLCVAFGFVLRIFAGAYAIDVAISPWIVLCTFLLSLFLAFSKRRHELVHLNGVGENHRPVLFHYSESFLDQMIAVVTSATVISYAIYTVSHDTIAHFGTDKLIYTVPFVLYGIFRYLYLVYRMDSGGNPTKVFYTDLPLLVNVFLWLVACMVIIYFKL